MTATVVLLVVSGLLLAGLVWSEWVEHRRWVRVDDAIRQAEELTRNLDQHPSRWGGRPPVEDRPDWPPR